MLNKVSLEDKYDLEKETILLTGTQSLVRAVMMQAARDKKNNINSAGYVTGYRGSPLGALDQQFSLATKQIEECNITFKAGLNEDTAATALWGSQQAELRGEGKYQGVFGLWYGKGPGVDRSGDVFRHANLAGTSSYGGVIVAMGDDHTGESSTTLHQSDYALVDAMMPIFSPSGVQELLDYSAYGWALSRYAGVWVGLKCIKDTIEVTQVVDGRIDRIEPRLPSDVDSVDNSIRLYDLPIEQEKRLHLRKLPAVKKFIRSNKINRIGLKDDEATIGIISAGKSWLDTCHALSILGIDEAEAQKLGLTTYKLGVVWPVEPEQLIEWANGLKIIVVVEEKRKLIESQVRNILYNIKEKPIVIGEFDLAGATMFDSHFALDPIVISTQLGKVISSQVKSKKISDKLESLSIQKVQEGNSVVPPRTPYFCSGCPHNTSTKIPAGSRAYAGIGCHYMAQWMDRETEGFTHMGGEGANWIGEAPFSERDHVFQNIGDGTYNHSGLMSIRAAVSAKVNITYKILYNDAVAMTGGQSNDGDLTALDIVHELKSIGVKEVILVYDDKEDLDVKEYNRHVKTFKREELNTVQKKLSQVRGVSALVYVQTCAAEKRRRRKRGKLADPNKRVFINPEVCEGCGDCGLQSNCISILPYETHLGVKRRIDQSACNKDFSCIDGFCPSFVTIFDPELKRQPKEELVFPDFPNPNLPRIQKTFNIVIAGVGGTGVVTIGALIAMSAHLEGKGVGVMEMAGLAQKGGAVHIHSRVAEAPTDINAVRVADAEVDTLLGCDLVVAAGEKTLSLLQNTKSKVVCANEAANAGEFTRDKNFTLPCDQMKISISAKVGDKNAYFVNASTISEKYLGDSIYANVLILGNAYQRGLLPFSSEAIEQAIRINGAGVQGNLTAFRLGRWTALEPEFFEGKHVKNTPLDSKCSLESILSDRKNRLKQYQNERLASKYEKLVLAVDEKSNEMALAVAESYYKLLAYKDEYEVARLHVQYLKDALDKEFQSYSKLSFYFAPTFLGSGKTRSKKREFGPWMLVLLRMLAKGRFLRGTVFDIFGYSTERKREKSLIIEFETDVRKILSFYETIDQNLAVERAVIPLDIKGFGHVKEQSIVLASEKRKVIMKKLELNALNLRAAE
ncbi:MAG: indolepyruvate ferredoxin oxidoreductase family protein [Pseudomonadota bacterium]|nr:indolepyruvate ferredoxin oxidoreductase family protein [Pseudomonadota bacterium]